MSTPYDGKTGLWHWKGSKVGERDIGALCETIRRYAPNADAIWVKTSHGNSWQGRFDEKPEMAVNGASDISKRISILNGYGLEFHAWCAPEGKDPLGEARLIVEACRVPGVRSMVLDIEPFEGFWEGNRNAVLQLMGAIRREIGPEFHIGLCVDPRRHHYNSIYPDAWRPYVNSVHPMVYWDTMQRDPSELLDETYVVWGPYGLPIFPVLQGSAEPAEIKEAQELARGVRGAMGLSYWRLGVIGPLQFPVINTEEVTPGGIQRYGEEIVIYADQPGFRAGAHTGQPIEQVFKEFLGVHGHVVKHKATKSGQDDIWAQWTPTLPTTGTYEVSAFVPGRHATTHNARYHIHGVAGSTTQPIVNVDQQRYSDQWVPLAVVRFDESSNAGRINLTDLTGEDGREIAFDAIRWRRIITSDDPDINTNVFMGAGFDSPVGTVEERLSLQVWPGDWFDATGYDRLYTYGAGWQAYHTGVDLNKNQPHWDADRDAPIYAPAAGAVTYSGNQRVWGWIIVIRHDPLPDGTVLWSRMAHVANAQVRTGDRVELGELIAQVGNADGEQPYHLHFDIAKTNVLEQNAGHWPGMDRESVRRNYLDPKTFIQSHRPQGRG